MLSRKLSCLILAAEGKGISCVSSVTCLWKAFRNHRERHAGIARKRFAFIPGNL
jgi:hypothetical protein